MSEEACRLDVWLHRARFMRTRALAAAFVEAGRVRVTRVGDELLFAIGGRVTSVRVAALGERRGPPEEARALYAAVSSEG